MLVISTPTPHHSAIRFVRPTSGKHEPSTPSHSQLQIVLEHIVILEFCKLLRLLYGYRSIPTMEGQSSRMGASEDDSSTIPLHLQPYGQYNESDVSHIRNGSVIFNAERGSSSNRNRHHVSKRTSMSHKTNGATATHREPISNLYHQTTRQEYPSPPLIPKLSRRKSSENLPRRHNGYKAVFGTHQQLYVGMLGLVIFSIFTMYFSIHVVNDPSVDISISGERGGSNSHILRPHRPWMMVWNTSDSNYLSRPQSENPRFMFHVPQASTTKSSTSLNAESSVADLFELSTTNTLYVEEEEIGRSEATSATNTSKCLPMAEWMKASFPNCNSIHEMDMKSSVSSFRINDNEGDLKFLGQGWFRTTWKYRDDNYQSNHKRDDLLSPTAVVLKTLRIEREFLDEYFDLHRRDAVAMERLTFSPYVVNIHGYCGQSAVNELAEGIVGGTITSLEQLNRRLRGKEEDRQALFLKLQLATKVAIGLAHIHNVHVSEIGGGRSASIQSLLYEHTDPKSSHSTTGFGMSIPTMAHYDVS